MSAHLNAFSDAVYAYIVNSPPSGSLREAIQDAFCSEACTSYAREQYLSGFNDARKLLLSAATPEVGKACFAGRTTEATARPYKAPSKAPFEAPLEAATDLNWKDALEWASLIGGKLPSLWAATEDGTKTAHLLPRPIITLPSW